MYGCLAKPWNTSFDHQKPACLQSYWGSKRIHPGSVSDLLKGQSSGRVHGSQDAFEELGTHLLVKDVCTMSNDSSGPWTRDSHTYNTLHLLIMHRSAFYLHIRQCTIVFVLVNASDDCQPTRCAVTAGRARGSRGQSLVRALDANLHLSFALPEAFDQRRDLRIRGSSFR